MLNIPSTGQLAEQNIANFESRLGQNAPLYERAFLRVLAAVLAMGQTGLYKFAVDRILQNSILTATDADLENIGSIYGVSRKSATFATVQGFISGTTGTVLPETTAFTASVNGLRYFVDANVTVVGETTYFYATAEQSGPLGNLTPGDTLTIVSPISGLASTAVVTASPGTTLGAEIEADIPYRQRILSVMRAVHGGSNAADYKTWAEEVVGVYRAFPYSGKHTGTSYPGDRHIYIECNSDIDADGIPSSDFLTEIKTAITAAPRREALGLTANELFLRPIVRSTINVEIQGLTVPSEAGEIEDAIASYLLGIVMFVDGIDFPTDRNDTVTALALGSIVNSIIGTQADGIQLQKAGGSWGASYQVAPGELLKLGAISYAP